MKAAIHNAPGDPDVLHYEDVPDPSCARDGVLIRVEAISIEGGDLIRRASIPPPSPKHVLGYAAAGEIVAVGADVEDRFIGQKVTSFDPNLDRARGPGNRRCRRFADFLRHGLPLALFKRRSS